MVSGTPIYGVYPYQKPAFCFQDALEGWPREHSWPSLKDVIIPEDGRIVLDGCDLSTLRDFLLQDPRPAYTRTGQENREFWTAYGEWVIWYEVHDEVLHVTRSRHLNGEEKRNLLLTGNLSNNHSY